jgi:adenylate cyclase
MFGELVPCGGGSPIPLRKTRLVVGRTADCDVPLPFPTVSSRHCQLEFRDGHWHVTDQGSRNGVRVNGVRCQQATIPPGGILAIAQFRFQLDYSVSTAPAPGRAAPPGTTGTEPVPIGRPVEAPRSAPSAPPRRPPAALGQLIPCGGGEPIPLLKSHLLVGRSKSCDITLPFPTVSGKHCELEFKEGFWHIRDLASSNGIKVNGHRYMSKYLRPGEILTIATQRYEVAYSPQEDEPPPDEDPFALSLLEKSGLARRDAAGKLPEFRPAPAEAGDRPRWVIDERDLSQ